MSVWKSLSIVGKATLTAVKSLAITTTAAPSRRGRASWCGANRRLPGLRFAQPTLRFGAEWTAGSTASRYSFSSPLGGNSAGRRDSRERQKAIRSRERRRGPMDPHTEHNDADRVYIFDTTLRDGEQSPGISLNTAEKVEIAQQLARLGVDVIEAGFPITSPGDFEAVQKISRVVEGPVICGLARTHKADIDAAWGAVKEAARPRIHTFISTSDIHIEHQLQTDREDVKGQARAAVAHAGAGGEDLEFAPMGAPRADMEFTAEVCAIAVEEGATTSNIPHAVGYTTPEEYADYFRRLYELVPALREVILSVHCHDDLGLAVANSFAGLRAGARQVECAINGIGERAGNASLE